MYNVKFYIHSFYGIRDATLIISKLRTFEPAPICIKITHMYIDFLLVGQKNYEHFTLIILGIGEKIYTCLCYNCYTLGL